MRRVGSVGPVRPPNQRLHPRQQLHECKWFGEVIISVKNGKWWFDSKRSPKLTGELFYFKGNTFIVKWKQRSFDADAFVTFQLDENGKGSGIKMKAISPLTDFSYATYLSDLAVRVSHQRQGIGKELMRRTQQASAPATIILLAAPAAEQYYPHVGFTHHPQAWRLLGELKA